MFVPYVLLILQKDDSVCLLKRAQSLSFGGGLYSLPGGKIEQDETAQQAAVREAKEELGITINEKDLEFVHLFHRKGATERIFAIIFKVKKWQGTPENKEPDKHDELQFFKVDQIPANMIPAHKQALEFIKKGGLYSEHGW
jgi:mutator protein MutT